ncbi:hypothetical protein [Zunongwangia sp. H14]|uniref:hypothetical protein n=1 Tax=Zunongwangia sp. H14 TaxID=3240792 RepID=UPI0035615E5E
MSTLMNLLISFMLSLLVEAPAEQPVTYEPKSTVQYEVHFTDPYISYIWNCD